MVIAFFDIDHTIIHGSSMERLFVRYLMKKGYIKAIDALRTVAFISTHLLDTSGIAMRSRRPYLQGKSVELMEAQATQCFNDLIQPLVSKDALLEIKEHKKAGHQIVLLSGTLEMLARLLCRYVDADYYIACRTLEVDGYFTGIVAPPIPYGEGKRKIVLSYAREKGINLRECYAYGDSMADLGVFESVGNSYMVNPGRRLSAIAQKRGWKIRYW